MNYKARIRSQHRKSKDSPSFDFYLSMQLIEYLRPRAKREPSGYGFDHGTVRGNGGAQTLYLTMSLQSHIEAQASRF